MVNAACMVSKTVIHDKNSNVFVRLAGLCAWRLSGTVEGGYFPANTKTMTGKNALFCYCAKLFFTSTLPIPAVLLVFASVLLLTIPRWA